jgi:hypothetical protein
METGREGEKCTWAIKRKEEKNSYYLPPLF